MNVRIMIQIGIVVCTLVPDCLSNRSIRDANPRFRKVNYLSRESDPFHDRDSSFWESLKNVFTKKSDVCMVRNLKHGTYTIRGSGSKLISESLRTIVSRGSYLKVVCDSGYLPNGENTFQCLQDTINHNTQCKKACSPLVEPTLHIVCKIYSRIVACDEYALPMTKATFRCDNRYVPTLEMAKIAIHETICLEGGTWSSPLYKCIPDGCRQPEPIENGFFSIQEYFIENNLASNGAVLEVSCVKGYKLNGPNTAVCLDHEWSEISQCLKTCPPLVSPTLNINCERHGQNVSCSEEMLPATIAYIACSHSFTLKTEPTYNKTECSFNGTWTLPLFACIPDGCPLPTNIIYGNFTLGNVNPLFASIQDEIAPFGSFLDIQCMPGYKLEDHPQISCRNGTWGEIPQCLKTCMPLKKSYLDITCRRNEQSVSCEKEMLPGTEATIKCKPYYEEISKKYFNRKTRCLKDGSWNKNLLPCTPDCGREDPNIGVLLIDGTNVSLGMFPWHVGIFTAKPSGWENICGGSILNEKVVITAAHCFEGNSVKSFHLYRVAAGVIYQAWKHPNEMVGQYRKVENIMIGPQYKGNSNRHFNDIALIIVKEPFKLRNYVLPICLDFQVVKDKKLNKNGTMAHINGWGFTTEMGNRSEILQTLTIPVIDNETCQRNSPTVKTLLRDKFCAGTSDGRNVCHGDSGGGLSVKSNSKHYLLGVTSSALRKNQFCDSHKFGLYTELSYYEPWIKEMSAIYANF